MKFNELWLREWVNPSISTSTLVEQMTISGFEVNSIKSVSISLQGVIIGEIIDCQKHKNDKTYITKVHIGNNRIFNVVCNALNCRQGIKTAIAVPGAILAGNVLVKKKKIYNIDSDGMLCSSLELGISDNHNGIIELPINAKIGNNILDYMQLKDTIFEINIPSNRADCFSIMGIAREVAAINDLKINTPEYYKEKNINYFDCVYPVSIKSLNVCPMYLVQVVKDIDIHLITPLWMQEKLYRCGITPINIVIDIINYVLIELGQPIHLLDLDLLEGEVIIRFTKENEIFKHDNNIIKLDKDTLVISDHKKILSLAGIVDSSHFTINNKTKNILLICAYFDPFMILNNVKKCNINTSYSLRYERGVDFNILNKTIYHVNYLFDTLCKVRLGKIIEKVNSSSRKNDQKIQLRQEKINQIIGYIIDINDITKILIRLGFKIQIIENKLDIIVPSWRFDIEIEIDIIEEILRIYGYNNIPDISINADLIIHQHSETVLSLNKVKNLLVNKGYNEAITYSFVDPLIQNLIHPNQNSLALLNPISTEMSVMRVSLWSGLLKTMLYNQKRQQYNIRIFESGFRFITDQIIPLKIKQEFVLSGILSGSLMEEQWGIKSQNIDFYDLKGDLESVLELTGMLDKFQFRLETHPALHPGQSAAIYLSEQRIGLMGMLNPYLASKFNLKNQVMMFEILWNDISNCLIPQINKISKYPLNRRDISIIVLENVSFADIVQECKKVASHNLVKINLFDIYRGVGINKGYKSLSISFILQDNTRTLKESDIIVIIDKCLQAIKERFQATLRENLKDDIDKS